MNYILYNPKANNENNDINIINVSEDKDLVAVMWANEAFNPERPDTYGETV